MRAPERCKSGSKRYLGSLFNYYPYSPWCNAKALPRIKLLESWGSGGFLAKHVQRTVVDVTLQRTRTMYAFVFMFATESPSPCQSLHPGFLLAWFLRVHQGQALKSARSYLPESDATSMAGMRQGW